MDGQKKIAISAGLLIVGLVFFSLSLSGHAPVVLNGFGAALVVLALGWMYISYRYNQKGENQENAAAKGGDNTLFVFAGQRALLVGLAVLLAAGLILQFFKLSQYAGICFYTICGFLAIYAGMYFYLKNKEKNEE